MSGKAFQPLAIAVLVLLPSLAGAAGGTDNPLAPGIQAFNARRYEEARAFFEPYARQHPQDAEAAFYLGKTWLNLRKPDAAAEWLEKAAALAPGRSDCYDWLGRAYGTQTLEASLFAKAGLATKTKEAWEKAVALDPNNLDARADLMAYALRAPGFMGGSLDLARQQAAEIQKRDGVRGAVAYATIALSEKDPATAEKGLKEAIQRWPAEPRLRLALGGAYQSQKKWDAAFDVYEAMAKADAANWDALFQIGKTAVLSGQRLDRAEECLKRYLGHTPGPDSPPLAYAQLRLGQVYEKKGNKTAARTAYQEALKLDPGLEDAKKALAALG